MRVRSGREWLGMPLFQRCGVISTGGLNREFDFTREPADGHKKWLSRTFTSSISVTVFKGPSFKRVSQTWLTNCCCQVPFPGEVSSKYSTPSS